MRHQDPVALTITTTPKNTASEIASAPSSPSDMRAFAAALAEQIEFSQRLRGLRRALGLTQSEVGEIIGEQQSEVSRMESGDANPSIARANQALDKLGAYAVEQMAAVVDAAGEGPTACQVADYLLLRQDPEDSMTNLKLQKLLYYAQGYALAILGRPIFPERIIAWEHGPVVVEVYNRYHNGTLPVPRPVGFEPTTLSPEIRELLDYVYEKLGQHQASRLRNMTHNEAPWKETPQSSEIMQEQLADYFSRIVARG
jgi:uncharacterized phage-associated protein/DNA-binding XRE family transcriptional regulator